MCVIGCSFKSLKKIHDRVREIDWESVRMGSSLTCKTEQSIPSELNQEFYQELSKV